MHDDEVGKVYMWLVVEELRAYQSVMSWGMLSSVLVPNVGSSGAPANLEVALVGEIPDPV